MNFWDELPDGFLILAPMEEVTDIVFRHTVAKAGRPEVFYTEFTNAASFCSEVGRLATAGRLAHDSSESPLVAQIWGTNPEQLAAMSQALCEQGFDGVDINMGCPAKHVVKSGAGSGLIGQIDLAARLIEAAKAGGLPVSVKTRLGVRHTDEWRPWLTALLEQNIVNLTVHLRTRKEMSKVPAHYELIDEICALRDSITPQTKLTINGDIRDRNHARELKLSHPGVNGFMIGRGVFANPFCFADSPEGHTQAELIELMRYQLDQYDEYRIINEKFTRKFDPLKHFFKIYLNGFNGAAKVREAAYNCTTTDAVRQVLKQAGL